MICDNFTDKKLLVVSGGAILSFISGDDIRAPSVLRKLNLSGDGVLQTIQLDSLNDIF